jgi:hypothetical protein
MFDSPAQPTHLPCPSCGASVSHDEAASHVCDEEQRLRYELFRVRLEVERFDGQLKGWLASAAGRFEVFYAERERLRSEAVA